MDENGMLSPQEAIKKAELLLKENETHLNMDEELMRICSFGKYCLKLIIYIN